MFVHCRPCAVCLFPIKGVWMTDDPFPFVDRFFLWKLFQEEWLAGSPPSSRKREFSQQKKSTAVTRACASLSWTNPPTGVDRRYREDIITAVCVKLTNLIFAVCTKIKYKNTRCIFFANNHFVHPCLFVCFLYMHYADPDACRATAVSNVNRRLGKRQSAGHQG